MALQVTDLGRMAYDEAFALQRRLQSEVIAGRETGDPTMHLLLVEHDPPVITISRRRGAREHLVASETQLEASGVTVRETDRGGDITYHGPGQLVAYPILDLNALGLRLHGYMRFLEQVVIDALEHFGVTGRRDPEATGVWVGGGDGGPTRKIAALGVRVSRWVSMHGLALNVAPDLRHFQLIVPCGLSGRPVTSLACEVAGSPPNVHDVKPVLAELFRRTVDHGGHVTLDQ